MSVVQSKFASSGYPHTSRSIAFNSSVTAGNLVIFVMSGGCSGGSAGDLVVSNGDVTTWTEKGFTSNISSMQESLWYGYSGGGTTSLSWTKSNTSAARFGIIEISGAVASGDPFDGFNSENWNHGGDHTTTAISPTSSVERLLLYSCFQQSYSAASDSPIELAGYTALDENSGEVGYKLVASTSGTYALTFASSYQRSALCHGAIMPGAGGGPDPFDLLLLDRRFNPNLLR